MDSPGPYRALREGTGLLTRSSRGRIAVSGTDRRAYLQGLLTNDIEALAPGTGCYAVYLTAQGRMISDMRVFELGDRILVDLEGFVAGAVTDRWVMFIFSEDVQVADITSSTSQLGFYGPSAAHVLAGVFAGGRGEDEPAPAPEALDRMPLHASGRWDFHGEPAFVLRSDDVGVAGFDVVVPVALKEEFERLAAAHGAVAVAPEISGITRVESGRPLFGIDMTEETIPLEAGIEGRAISLTKGCYVGQEIIIRVLHRGHGRVAKRLIGLAFDAGTGVPASGEKVFSGDREIGVVTSAVRSPLLGHPIALAYLHRDFVEPGTVVAVRGETERAATVRSLPFVDAAGRIPPATP